MATPAVKISSTNVDDSSPVTMLNDKENDKVGRAATDVAMLKATVKELAFAASPEKKQLKDEAKVPSPDPPGWGVNFSPSQLSPSKINLYGGRRRVRMLYGQDPDENPELFTPPRKGHRVFNPEYKWPTDEEAMKYIKFAFAAYHN